MSISRSDMVILGSKLAEVPTRGDVVPISSIPPEPENAMVQAFKGYVDWFSNLFGGATISTGTIGGGTVTESVSAPDLPETPEKPKGISNDTLLLIGIAAFTILSIIGSVRK